MARPYSPISRMLGNVPCEHWYPGDSFERFWDTLGIRLGKRFAKKRHMPLFEEFRETSQDMFGSDIQVYFPWDVSRNSSKSGFLQFSAWMDGQWTEVRIYFIKIIFFKKLNYRNLEIRVLHENSLRADLVSALYNVFLFF